MLMKLKNSVKLYHSGFWYWVRNLHLPLIWSIFWGRNDMQFDIFFTKFLHCAMRNGIHNLHRWGGGAKPNNYFSRWNFSLWRSTLVIFESLSIAPYKYLNFVMQVHRFDIDSADLLQLSIREKDINLWKRSSFWKLIRNQAVNSDICAITKWEEVLAKSRAHNANVCNSLYYF